MGPAQLAAARSPDLYIIERRRVPGVEFHAAYELVGGLKRKLYSSQSRKGEPEWWILALDTWKKQKITNFCS